MKLHLFAVAIYCLLISCRSEVNVIAEKNSDAKTTSEWPKTQEKVDDIFTHYEKVASDHLVYVEDRLAVKQDGKWGVIDSENNLYFPFEYDTLVSNLSSVALRKNGLYTIYDPARTVIAEVRADHLTPIFDHFYLSSKNEKLALINPNGMAVTEHRFDAITGPRDESYFLGKTGETWEAYDMAGQMVDSASRANEAIKWLTEYRVALKSYGPLQFGMSKEEIEKVVGWKLKELYGDEFCSIFNLGDDFLDIELMINNSIEDSKTLERIYILSPEINTKSGIGCGSSKKEVIDAYGSKIEVKPNNYDAEARNLFYVPTDNRDKQYRLNFLVIDDHVVRYSVGRLPSINFGEGCL